MPSAKDALRAEAPRLPSGTVVFLFTDIEGSTVRWESRREEMRKALELHDRLVRDGVEAAGGHVFKMVGDQVCAVFETAPAAVGAALSIQRSLQREDWTAVDGLLVRMSLHAGNADERDGDYFGPALNRVARLLSIAHGGQVLLTAATAELAQHQLPRGATLRDLGSHRLKDLAHPEQVFQLATDDLRSDFPALRSLAGLPNNLPQQLTTFVGRDSEIGEIERLIADGARLLTLTGSGGIGKTRTSLQVAAELMSLWPDGVWLIELASITSGDLIGHVICSVLKIAAPPAGSPLDAIAMHLHSKRALLILDNCEHIVTSCARVASEILQRCPRVSLLVNSREGLGIEGEVSYRLPPLSVPPKTDRLEAAVARTYGSVTLFSERASASDTHFRLTDDNARIVGEICRKVDGIPLAIELAAARCKTLSPGQLLHRLDERFRVLTSGRRDVLPRQQTLRALIDWSFDLLSEQEQTLLVNLAIFVDGWTLEMATEVCSDLTTGEWDVFDLLSSLVEKSLVSSEPAGAERRYRLLESTRQYALDKQTERGNREVLARRHAEVFLALAERAEAAHGDVLDDSPMVPLGRELDNIRAALDWAMGPSGDLTIAAGLASASAWAFRLAGWHAEALRRLQKISEFLPPDDARMAARVYTEIARLAGDLRLDHRRLDAARKAVAEARASQDNSLLARALLVYSMALTARQELEDARDALDEAEELSGLVSSPRLSAMILDGQGALATSLGDYTVASERRAMARELYREHGAERNEIIAVLNLAESEHMGGRTGHAIELLREVLQPARQLKLVGLLENILTNLAGYLVAADDLNGAREAAREALEVARANDPETSYIAIAIEHIALVAALDNQPERAARLLGYTSGSHSLSGFQREFTEQLGYERLMTILRHTYNDDAIASLLAQGSAFFREHAIAVALSI